MLIWYAWPQAIVHKGSTITHFEEEPIKVPSDTISCGCDDLVIFLDAYVDLTYMSRHETRSRCVALKTPQ